MRRKGRNAVLRLDLLIQVVNELGFGALRTVRLLSFSGVKVIRVCGI